MTMAPNTPPPGWYPNQQGHMQWWDGHQWGQLAHAPSAVAPAPYYQPARPMKDTGIAYLLAILLGGFAAHRFYLGQIGSAVAFLVLWWGGWALTFIFIGFVMVAIAAVWWIVDLFIIPSMVRTANGMRSQ
ncbi:NINE protein [Microbacterium sp. XT11]|uniref:NINE protein n=1 Tax=Microbacterium sp. XT11 TaxID=367477 RepID=UPI000A42DC22|nr:NINE protein [Microbacterium sp. XT11]